MLPAHISISDYRFHCPRVKKNVVPSRIYYVMNALSHSHARTHAYYVKNIKLTGLATITTTSSTPCTSDPPFFLFSFYITRGCTPHQGVAPSQVFLYNPRVRPIREWRPLKSVASYFCKFMLTCAILLMVINVPKGTSLGAGKLLKR